VGGAAGFRPADIRVVGEVCLGWVEAKGVSAPAVCGRVV